MNIIKTAQIGAKALGGFVKANSPMILTMLGCGGMVCAVFTAVHESKFVDQDLKELEKKELHEAAENESGEPKHPFWPRAKIYISNYWPAALLIGGSVVSIFYGQRIQSQRTAAALAAYQLSAMNLKDLKEKIIEMDGEKKLKSLQDDIAKDKVKNEAPSKEVIIVGDGEHLIYDVPSGRYFMGNIEKVRQAVSDFNRELYNAGTLSLNEWYDYLGLDHIGTGNRLGWIMKTTDDLLDMEYSSQITETGKPCLTLKYDVKPIFTPDW